MSLHISPPTGHASPPPPPIDDVASLRARMADAGFRPVAVYTTEAGRRLGHEKPGKHPFGNAWQERARRDPPDAVIAKVHPDATNTGLLCDGWRAFDYDIDNPTLAHSCVALAYDTFGEAPTRYRSNSPRRAILYRAAEGEPPKTQIAGTLGKIECLGRGQQIVCFGDHESGTELQWVGEAPGEALADSIPAITEEQVFDYLTKCAVILGASPPVRANGHDGEHTSGEPQADPLRVAGALADIPNDGPANWDWWNTIAMAVWRATGGSQAGWMALDCWSARNAAYDPQETRKRWDHYPASPPTKIGAGSIFFLAKEARAKAETIRLFEPRPIEPLAFFDPWEEPAPPDWPMGILAPHLESMLSQVSIRDGIDYGALCASHVAAASGAAPKDARFFPYADGTIESNWWVPPIIWFMLINESGQRKTQIKQIAFGRLVRINADLWRDYCQRLDAWNAQSEDDKRQGSKPAPPHTFVADDVSVEAMQMILARNPRGTLYLKDELAAFFEFGRYAGAGKGQAERAYYLETYEAHPKNISRVGRDPLFIETNGLTIFGSIQPTRLAEFKGLESDGLLQRFCQLLPRRSATSQPDTKVSGGMFDGIIDRLTKLKADRPYTTNAEGVELIRRSEHEAAEFSEITDFGIGFQGWCSKMHGTHARLALILHLMGDAYDKPLIPPETIARARRLVRGYLLPHTREFYRTLPDSNMMLMRDIGGWILTKAKDRFVASDVVAGVKAMRGMGTKEIAELLDAFVAGGWVEPETRFPNNKAWLIYPDARPAFAARAEAERARRADMRARMTRTAKFDE